MGCTRKKWEKYEQNSTTNVSTTTKEIEKRACSIVHNGVGYCLPQVAYNRAVLEEEEYFTWRYRLHDGLGCVCKKWEKYEQNSTTDISTTTIEIKNRHILLCTIALAIICYKFGVKWSCFGGGGVFWVKVLVAWWAARAKNVKNMSKTLPQISQQQQK